jgi:hypothetical protein
VITGASLSKGMLTGVGLTGSSTADMNEAFADAVFTGRASCTHGWYIQTQVVGSRFNDVTSQNEN